MWALNSMGEDLMNGMRSTKGCRYKCLLALGLKSQSTSIPFCPKGQKNFFWRPPPPYLRVWMTPPPPIHTHTDTRPPHPRPPYFKVWSRHWKVPLSGGAFSCRSSNWVPPLVTYLLPWAFASWHFRLFVTLNRSNSTFLYEPIDW